MIVIFGFVLFSFVVFFFTKIAHPKVLDDRRQNYLNYSKETCFYPFVLEIYVPRFT